MIKSVSSHAVPETPTDIVVEPTYNDNNLFLNRLEVQWRVQASGSVFFDILIIVYYMCIINGSICHEPC